MEGVADVDGAVTKLEGKKGEEGGWGWRRGARNEMGRKRSKGDGDGRTGVLLLTLECKKQILLATFYAGVYAYPKEFE